MVTLESSLASLKIALTQFGATSPVNQASALLSTSQSAVGTSAATGAAGTSTLSLSQTSTKALDMQRQLDSAYRAQAMLEVAGKANASIINRLKDLRKIAVQASSDTVEQSDRAFLISQFEGVRQSLVSQAQNTRWDGMRLFDGTAGSKRNGILSFNVGSGSSGKIDISLPNLRADAVRASGLRAVQGSLGAGTSELQTISLADASLSSSSAALSVGDVTLNSGTLGADASLSDLIAGLTSDANYADAPFTLADNGSGALAIAWKNTGAVTSTAQLQLTAETQSIAATRSVTGASTTDLPAAYEEQFITLSDSNLASAVSVMLNDGTDSQNNFGLVFSAGSTTLSDVADALNTNYASTMPFTVSAESDGLRLTWSGSGAQTGLASLAVSSQDAAQTSYTTSTFDAQQVTAGADAGSIEVQNITLSDAQLQGKNLTLTANGVTLSSGDMASDATLGDLVTALQSDANYSAAGFEIAQNVVDGETVGLKLTWTSADAVAELATLSMTSSVATTTVTAGQTVAGADTSIADGTQEVQRIAVRASAINGRNVQLRAGDFSLFSGTLDSNASVSQLASALQANPRYDAAPFTVSQDRPGYLTLTWKTPGTVSQLAALEVQPANPLTSVMKRGGIRSAEAAQSMLGAIDLAMHTMSGVSTDLSVAGVKLAAAVQALSATRNSLSTSTSGQLSGQAFASAITSMLRTQISDNATQAALAQANYTPQSVINTLSV